MAIPMGTEHVFVDLRRLADWFSTSPQRASSHIEKIVHRLGTTAIPLLTRELRAADPRRRLASRAALESLARADAMKPRVIAALRSIIDDDGPIADDTKVCALGLLAELGEQAAATFANPGEIQQRSAIALAEQLCSDADVASAADLMVRQLAVDDMISMVDVMAESVPSAAHRLARELTLRLDLPPETRERIACNVFDDDDDAVPASAGERRRGPRPAQVAVLVDASARIVVVVSRKMMGERRWRRWAVLIDATGRIDDCLHEDRSDDDAAPLIAQLCADGYRVASADLDHARMAVATAAQLTATSPTVDASGQTTTLCSSYYLGRDLLGLASDHLGDRRPPRSSTVARAIELFAEGDHVRAAALLERCEPTDPDAAGLDAALALTRGDPAAATVALDRALAVEPEWPLHHWNLAVALHQLGDAGGCFHALRRFATTSARPTGLDADPDQLARLATAGRMIAELERTARIMGTTLRRRRRRTTTGASRRSGSRARR